MVAQQPDVRPERIVELSQRLSSVAGAKIKEISTVNRAATMLSINALIVAARAGEAGKGFAIVAEEFKNIAGEIATIAAALESQVQVDLNALTSVGGAIIGQMGGQRLADLSLNAIEIIDRNLYERTCDVRWWATDSAVVDCVADPTAGNCSFASDRLRVILDAYTVYLDLWICDANGKVLANGQPRTYPKVKGMSVANASWFSAAMRSASGDDFSVADIERVPALQNAPVATYAAAIREGGRKNGAVIGVLGIHFDWMSQAQTVVNGVRLTPEERRNTRVMILDGARRVLAASDERGVLDEIVNLDVSAGQMGSYAKGDTTVAYALTPGYETYKGLGWYGCIVQKKDKPEAFGTPAGEAA